MYNNLCLPVPAAGLSLVKHIQYAHVVYLQNSGRNPDQTAAESLKTSPPESSGQSLK